MRSLYLWDYALRTLLGTARTPQQRMMQPWPNHAVLHFKLFRAAALLIRFLAASLDGISSRGERTNERPLMFVRSSASTLLLLVSVAVLGTGCVTNGRRLYLKEYGPSVAITNSNSLQGVTVCLKGFEPAADLIALELQSKPEELEGFKYRSLTREQETQWDKEMRALQKQSDQPDIKIGNMRNGFGMVMSHVYALNDPSGWMLEGLKYDLEAQGAKVVDASQAATADVIVGGKLRLFRVDMYMTVNSSIVVDLTVQPKGGPARQRAIHTNGATAAMLASEGEYFHALRDARQKFSMIVAKEITQSAAARQ